MVEVLSRTEKAATINFTHKYLFWHSKFLPHDEKQQTRRSNVINRREEEAA